MLTVTVTSMSHMTNVIAFKEDERRNTTNSYLRSHPHKHQTYKYEYEYEYRTSTSTSIPTVSTSTLTTSTSRSLKYKKFVLEYKAKYWFLGSISARYWENVLTVKRFSVSSSSCMHSQLHKAEIKLYLHS